MRPRWKFLVAAVAVLGCEGRRTVTGTAPSQRLTVRVHVVAELASAAQKLGWTGSAVPGAVVVAEFSSDNSSQLSADSAMTDASGVSRFGDLRLGRYTVRVSRALAPAE